MWPVIVYRLGRYDWPKTREAEKDKFNNPNM